MHHDSPVPVDIHMTFQETSVHKPLLISVLFCFLPAYLHSLISKWSLLLAPYFVDISSARRLRLIASAFHTLYKMFNVVAQVGFVGIFLHSVDSCRFPAIYGKMNCFQGFYSDERCQVFHSLSILTKLSYAVQFRYQYSSAPVCIRISTVQYDTCYPLPSICFHRFLRYYEVVGLPICRLIFLRYFSAFDFHTAIGRTYRISAVLMLCSTDSPSSQTPGKPLSSHHTDYSGVACCNQNCIGLPMYGIFGAQLLHFHFGSFHSLAYA